MLLSYYVSFFYAAFTHLVSFPLILVYPIISGISILFYRNIWVRLFYAMLCFSACSYTVYPQQLHFGSSNFSSEILPSILICIALMFAFPVITIINTNILYEYQNQLEEKQLSLKQKNEELNTYINSNLQLEKFAHLASNELKTPLNNMTNLAGLLKIKTKERLSQKELEIMEILDSEVKKMNNLIADLLQFSKVKNEEITFEKINIDHLINHLLERYFKENLPQIKKEIYFEDIMGHEDLLNQLFINLIENALKFSKNSIDPQISIKGLEHEDFYEFSIADNGIGIKQEFRERIFLIFKRLHNNSEYPGTGIGLSICKSIVERHQGDIWIEENPAGGSIFKFTLNKNLKSLKTIS